MVFKERKTRIEKDVLRLFVEDAKEQGLSLRAYCRKHGIDYYQLTGFPSPVKEVPLEEAIYAEGQKEGDRGGPQ
jgi:hypothetical protein